MRRYKAGDKIMTRDTVSETLDELRGGEIGVVVRDQDTTESMSVTVSIDGRPGCWFLFPFEIRHFNVLEALAEVAKT